MVVGVLGANGQNVDARDDRRWVRNERVAAIIQYLCMAAHNALDQIYRRPLIACHAQVMAPIQFSVKCYILLSKLHSLTPVGDFEMLGINSPLLISVNVNYSKITNIRTSTQDF